MCIFLFVMLYLKQFNVTGNMEAVMLMDNIYQYRKHIRYTRNIVPLIMLIPIAAIWITLIYFKKAPELLGVIAAVTFILLAETIVLWLFLGRFTKVKVKIGSDGITYTNYKGDLVINYEDITAIEFPSINYIGGWIKIKSGSNTIRLTVVVENIKNLLLDLKQELDKRNLSDKYDQKRFFNFVKTSAYSDESWGRVYRIWWILMGLTLATTSIRVGIGYAFNLNFRHSFFSLVISFLFPTIVYLISEFVFGIRIAKLSKRDTFFIPSQDLIFEKKVFRLLLLLGSIFYVLFLILAVLK